MIECNCCNGLWAIMIDSSKNEDLHIHYDFQVWWIFKVHQDGEVNWRKIGSQHGGYPAKGSELSNEEAGASKAKRINSVGRYSPCLCVWSTWPHIKQSIKGSEMFISWDPAKSQSSSLWAWFTYSKQNRHCGEGLHSSNQDLTQIFRGSLRVMSCSMCCLIGLLLFWRT